MLSFIIMLVNFPICDGHFLHAVMISTNSSKGGFGCKDIESVWPSSNHAHTFEDADMIIQFHHVHEYNK